jgi:hypothetical protein
MSLIRNRRFLFYLGWTCLALFQAATTELQDDEAYYWVFSKFPAWGYFDHPPITAMLIRGGYALVSSELGVRILFVFLNVLTLFLIEKLTDRKQPVLFYTIALSLAVLQLLGIMAVPDTVLIFFTALFFVVYRRFCGKPSPINIILLSLTISCLLYTKYQGLLVVLLAVLSNARLFLNYRIYLVGIFSLLMFLPHLVWQYDHNWISFRYHLTESNVNAYRVSFSLNYLVGQLLMAGPIAGIILIPAAVMYRPVSRTDKAMKWVLVGTYAFFFLSSFRGKVETNWTSATIVPLFVLSYRFLLIHFTARRWLWRLLPYSLILVLAARVFMIVDIAPVEAVRQRFHAWKQWPSLMKERTHGLPVVFSNSYQRASKYWFYTGQVTHSQNHVRDHRNNFDLWPVEKELLGKPVFFMDIYGIQRFPDSLNTTIGTIGYRYDSSFSSFAGVQFQTGHSSYRIRANELLLLQGNINMPDAYRVFLSHGGSNAQVSLFIFKEKTVIRELLLSQQLNTGSSKAFLYTVSTGLSPGIYTGIISVTVPGYNPTHNSEKIKIIVTE